MSDALQLLLSLLTGMALGGIFFGGLWWTIRRGLMSAHPAALFLASGLLRMGVTLAGFYFVSDGQWQRLLLCLAGFLVARALVTLWTRKFAAGLVSEIREADHASQP